MSRLTTKQRRAARKRHEVYRPAEARRKAWWRYGALTATEVTGLVEDEWARISKRPEVIALHRRLEDEFLAPLLGRALAALAAPATRWFSFVAPGLPPARFRLVVDEEIAKDPGVMAWLDECAEDIADELDRGSCVP